MLVFVQRERNNIVFTRQSNWRPLCTEMEGSLLVKYAFIQLNEKYMNSRSIYPIYVVP